MTAIDFSQVRTKTARETIAALLKDGFSLERQVGSHQQYFHPDGRRVTISSHLHQGADGRAVVRLGGVAAVAAFAAGLQRQGEGFPAEREARA